MSTGGWKITMKPNFTAELMALPPREVRQVMAKIHALVQDPQPDAKVKKLLKHSDPPLCRLRCGDYRIFYTFRRPFISLLALRRRREDTYDKDLEAEFLGGFDPDLPTVEAPMTSQMRHAPEEWFIAPVDPVQRLLPEPITKELLNNLRIPAKYHVALLAIQSEDEFLKCSSVPQSLLERLMEYLFPRPLQEVMQQPDLVLQEVDDLLRFKKGELLGFLLELSPEQEKYVQWASHADGATLLKGGPGTGKSMIALYRVRALVQELRQQGRDDFRILFTTYTNSLVRLSEQLLRQLLGQDVRYVDVKTTDALVVSLLGKDGTVPHPATGGEVRYCLRQAIKKAHFDGNSLQQQVQRQTIESLSQDYLEQEINQVIIARQLSSIEEYLGAARPGRQVSLDATQRMAVWSVYEAYRALLEQRGWATWQQLRVRAEQCVAHKRVSLRYDAVIIDEAQDLDVSALRMLIQLCVSPDRLFITADADQAIYGSGFSWNDVHTSLRFQGRIAVVSTNYRSTREIGEATLSYLGDGGLEQEAGTQGYAYTGMRPCVRAVASDVDEIEVLKRFLVKSARDLHFSLGSCAIFCPTTRNGKRIAQRLTRMGLPATFMSPKEVDLERPDVKVMTFKAAKGLEFPIVAVAGFVESRYYTDGDDTEDIDHQEEHDEALARNYRNIYVGMTRAMRALLVIVPVNTSLPLLTGFDPTYWDMT
jgi:superfamily I DNA/RNA helicase/mRNA-degrading endonuclease RelE of RelBE toxin-antitoxin system